MTKKDKYKRPWNEFAQKYLDETAPSTPSKDEIKIINQYINKILKKNKRPEVLILGCTTNYRKPLAKRGIATTMVDISKDMYDANTSALKGMKRKEKFVKGNWLTFNLKKKFDLILADYSINNVPYKDRDKMYKNTLKHLKEDGIVIIRYYHQPKKQSKQKALKYYKNKKMSRKYITYLWWDALTHFSLDVKKNTLRNVKAYKELKKEAVKCPWMKKWIKNYEKKIPLEDKEWVIIPKEKQEKEAARYFKIIAIKYAKGYKYCDYTPTYILTRK